MDRLVTVTLVVAVAFSFTVQAGTIKVNVEGIESKKGTVFIGVFERESFPESGEEMKGVKLEADDSDLTHSFTELPTGQYAISLFHDKNDNGKLDRNLLGMPQEKYGFTNDAFNWYGGPPNFDEAMVTLEKEKRLEVTVKARSWPPQV